MADYRLPVDDDGVKYHGVVDDDGQYPGQVLYGVDENGDYRPVNVDKDGNVLTKVTGSIVEYDIANQVEIRDEEVHAFPLNIPKGLRGFDIIITDTHHMLTGDNKYQMFDLYLGIYKDSSYPFGNFSVFADDGEIYNWVVKTWAYAEFRRLRTKIPSFVSRAGLNRKGLLLSQILRDGVSEFYIDRTLRDDVDYVGKSFPYSDMVRSIISQGSTDFNIQFEGLPEDVEEVGGSISIKFRGYY